MLVKKNNLIFWIRAGFLALILTIVLIGFFTLTIIRGGSKNIEHIIEDQRLMAKNLNTSQDKMETTAKQMGNISDAVSTLNLVGDKHSIAMTEVSARNMENASNLQKIVSSVESFTSQKEPIIRNLNGLDVAVNESLVEIFSIMGGYKEEAELLTELLDRLFTLMNTLKERVSLQEDIEKTEEIMKYGRVFAGIVEEFIDLLSEGAALNKITEAGEESIEYAVELKTAIKVFNNEMVERVDAEMAGTIRFANAASAKAQESIIILDEAQNVARSLGNELDLVNSMARASQEEVTAVAKELAGYVDEAAEVEAGNQIFLDRAGDRLLLTIILALGLAPFFGLLVAYFTTRYLSRSLTLAIKLLSGGSSKLDKYSQEISSAGITLSESTAKQATALTETSSVLEGMTLSSKTAASNAGQAEELSSKAKQLAGRGYEKLSKLVESTIEVNEQSSRISAINKVIDEIAFKTNILALNAAVEAARAGEHGLAFAVVADEVRNLALQSAEAARNTEELISENIKKVSAMTETTDQFKEMLEDMVKSIGESTESIKEIAKVTEEQAEGIEQINAVVDDLEKTNSRTLNQAEMNSDISAALMEEIENVGRIIHQLTDLVGGNNSRETKDPESARKIEPDVKPLMIESEVVG